MQHWWRHKSGSQAMGTAGAMNQWIFTSAWIGLQPHNTRDGTRAHNLLLREEAPHPLGHTSSCQCNGNKPIQYRGHPLMGLTGHDRWPHARAN